MKHVYTLLAVLLTSSCLFAQTPTTFNFNGSTSTGEAGVSGSPQTYTVPAGVTAIAVDMKGASGGFPCCSWYSSSPAGPRANGGRVQCTINVTPGQTLYVYVGGHGGDNYNSGTQCPGGWNGGGAGGASGSAYCAGGGGASDIRTSTSGPYASSVIVVAGGGGGGGDFGPVGGAGGGTTGGSGGFYTSGVTVCGGTQTGPGCSGSYAGTQGQGGQCFCYSRGGGGGGWWGGNCPNNDYDAGGGGSSYPAAPTSTVTAIVHTQGYSGADMNGQVIITPLPPTITATPSSLAFGLVTTGSTSGTMSFSMAGSNLTGGDITVTAPSNFEVSLTGTSGWGSSVNASYTGAALSATTVYVRFSPTAIIAYSGNITLTGGGVSTAANVAVSGNGAPPCSGTPTAGTLSSSTAPPACGSVTTTLTATGATSTSGGIVNQWQSSPTGSTGWTDISGATANTYVPTVTSTTYYRRTTTCVLSSMTAITPTLMVSVNPIPVITGGTGVCVGGTTSMFSDVPGGTWISSGSAIIINSSTGVASTSSTSGSAVVSYTLPTGCRSTQPMVVNTLVPTVSASRTPGTICAGGTVSLTATPTSTLPGYNVTSIPYSFTTQTSPVTASFTSIDDGYATVTIPFSFTFWGTAYTTAYIGSNGYIAFGSATSTYGAASLPSSSYPATIIYSMGDLYVGSPGSVKYSTEGTAPNRVFVVTFDQIGNCCSYNDYYDAQIKMYETSNTVEIHISKSLSGTRSIGIQNAGTQAVTPPGRNYASYSIAPSSPEAYRFTIPQATYAWSPSTFLSSTTGDNVVASGITTTPVITYTVARIYDGCFSTATATVTVNPVPAAITGTATVCEGLTTSLSSTSTGGVWQSSTAAAGTINSTSGLVAGIAAGTTNVSYTFSSTGCRTTKVVTVNPVPANVTGIASECVGASSLLSTTTTGGSWSSGTPSVATITSSGVTTGVLAGLSNITYSLPTGCIATRQMTINPLPTVNVTPATSAICAGSSASLSASSPALTFSLLNQDFNSGLGLWTISSPINPADAVSSWRVTSSSAAGFSGDGTAMVEAAPFYGIGGLMRTYLISPSFSTMGFGSAVLTFNETLVSSASADVNVLVEYSIDNGSTWAPLLDQLDSLVGDGTWTVSSPEVSVTMPLAAMNVPNVKLRWLYESNFGGWWEMDNIAVKAQLPDPGFVWAPVGGSTGLSCTTCDSVDITPTASGVNLYRVTGTTSSGCSAIGFTSVLVNPQPATIGGTLSVCEGAAITLSNASFGGSWSSGDDSKATVAGLTGIVTGVNAGTVNVTYTMPTGCRSVAVVTVNDAPSDITGVPQVCNGLTTALTIASTGGTWSSASTGVASVDATGLVTGNGVGSATISYTNGNGCAATKVVTVNNNPVAITAATFHVCETGNISLSNVSLGGSWSSSDASVATVIAGSGVVNGVAAIGGVAATANISYTLPTGCMATHLVTVEPLPASITGPNVVCQTESITLASSSPGGSWSVASTVVASVNAASGEVTGGAAGTTIVTYALPTGCKTTATVNVNPQPSVIAGSAAACEGQTTTLYNTDGGGTWVSSNTSVADISNAGVVSGHVSGSTTVTYTLPTGCSRTVIVTVNAQPSAVTGTRQACQGASTTLNSTPLGGSWTSGAPGVAAIDAATGIVSASTTGAGPSPITYTLPNGCRVTTDVTVNALPGDILGNLAVCEGLTTSLANSSTGGTWDGNTAQATINAVNGVVSGIVAGVSNISYILPTGCLRAAQVTVNALPGDISGSFEVCKGLTTTLSNSMSGGQWISSNTSVAGIDAAGIVSAVNPGTAVVTYKIAATGCLKTEDIVVNPLPADIVGPSQVCVGSTITMTDATSGGAWSLLSADATVSAAGIVTGSNAGSTTIVYTLLTGCLKSANIIVNPLPAPITGTFAVCENATTTLATLTTGGSWSSGSLPNAEVDADGVVAGIAAGNAFITYKLPTGCLRSEDVAVHALPADISGVSQVCLGLTTTLHDATIDGIWSSDASAIAAINTAGEVSGLAVGSANITYTLPTGCAKSVNVVVNALPNVITGTAEVCEGLTTTLGNTTPGGAWVSASATIAHVDVSSGIVTGVHAGTVDIAYVLSTGCLRTVSYTVKALPEDITGTTLVCEGLTTALANMTLGGAWSSDNALKASVDATGVVTGESAGIANIFYTALNGCSRSVNMLVNSLPDNIVGAPAVCEGSTTTWTNTTPGGAWTSSAMATANIDMLSGVVSGVASGTATITYALTTGCLKTADILVNALPASIGGTLAVCKGSTTMLSNGVTGGTWSASSAYGTVDATGVVTGTSVGVADITYALATGCSRTAGVVVNALPDVYNVIGGGSYCAGAGGVAIDGDGSQLGVQYQLYNGSAAAIAPIAGTGSAFSFGIYTTSGTYTVLATNAVTGCTNGMANNATVVILPQVTPSVAVASAAGSTVCAGTIVSYTATPVDGGTLPAYSWDVNGITMATSGSSFSYAPLNGDIVKVTLTSNAICAVPAIVTDVLMMTVNANETPVATISMPAGVTSVCQEDHITLTATSVYGGTAPVYTWYKGGVATGATGATYTYAPNNGDLITSKVTSNYACLATPTAMSNTLTMATDPVYVPSVSVSVSPGASITPGTTVTFNAVFGTSAGPWPSYQWYKNGLAISGATNVTYVTSALANNDSITCKVTSADPCSHESFNSVLMRVKQTGVAQLSGNTNIMLVPNPNEGDFIIKGQLESASDEELSIEVTNMLGQIVYRAKVNAVGGNINERVQLSNSLANGMYMLNLRSGGDVKVFHFVLEQ